MIRHDMKNKTLLLLLLASLTACGGNTPGSGRAAAARQTAPAAAEPVRYTYRIRKVYPHPADAYTQGLQYVRGTMWEGTGQCGASVVRRTDLETGRSETVVRLPRSEFGEGIALLHGKLYQLTWQSNVCHVYDTADGMRKIRDFRYPGEGWGLTTDGEKLYLSDGTETIFTVDPETFRREKRTTVTYRGEPLGFLNELEWIEGKIWANVYTTDLIAIIDPATGIVEATVDLAGLLPESERRPETDVLNGIAYDAESKRIFVTGKNWSKLFEIELIAE